jgi:type I restriction enzyme S subunit
MTARGATITHAKTLWLDCIIPLPNQPDSDRVIKYISSLMQAIVEKEIAIKERSNSIHNAIQLELESNQKKKDLRYEYPHFMELKKLGRLDAAIYSDEYKSKIWLIENYAHGYVTPAADGFTVIPGPSLEIKLLGTRLNSDVYKSGFYALILPTNISVYGTMNTILYIGTKRKLPLLQKGDIVFGEAGFQKGRSIVLLEGVESCTTNAHGLYARRTDGDVDKSIFFRCIFDWYRSMRLIDLMAVGGSGGHFSPEYFNYIRIPKFPNDKQAEIIRLYHNSSPPPPEILTLDEFLDCIDFGTLTRYLGT